MRDDAALVTVALADGPEAFGPIIECYQEGCSALRWRRCEIFTMRKMWRRACLWRRLSVSTG